MSRPYGKLPMRGRKSPEVPQPTEIRVNLTERHTMEQLALEVQRALAIVEELGAAGVERFRIAFLPLDTDAAPVMLRDGHGQPVTTINIPELPPEKPYRDDEPGLGVLPKPASRHRRTGPSAASAAAPGRAPGAVPPRR